MCKFVYAVMKNLYIYSYYLVFQYQEDLNELNEIARHRPRSSLIMNLAQENTQIRELQAENRDLRLALEEHQNALELIMSKYREQIVKLMLANKLDRSTTEADQNAVSIIRIEIIYSLTERFKIWLFYLKA